MSDQKLIIGYYRLSMEDDSEGESNSIINQRKLVKDYISNIPELVAMPFQEFYDDGYSGSSREGKCRQERFAILKEIAEYQLKILNEADRVKTQIGSQE